MMAAIVQSSHSRQLSSKPPHQSSPSPQKASLLILEKNSFWQLSYRHLPPTQVPLARIGSHVPFQAELPTLLPFFFSLSMMKESLISCLPHTLYWGLSPKPGHVPWAESNLGPFSPQANVLSTKPNHPWRAAIFNEIFPISLHVVSWIHWSREMQLDYNATIWI